MAWGDNGITNRRILRDQSDAFTFGAAPVRVPTRNFNQVGYLARVRAKFPTAGAAIVITTAQPVTVQTSPSGVIGAGQQPASRAINSLDIQAQGIAQLYSLGHGFDVPLLQYVGNGKHRSDEWPGGLYSAPMSGTGQSNTVYGKASANTVGYAYFMQVGAGSGTGQSVAYGAEFDLPLTEWVKFPAVLAKGSNGQPVAIPAMEVEVGLVTLQNVQANLVPHVTVNPLIGAPASAARNNPESLFEQPFGQAASGTLASSLDLYTEFYDVPDSLADQPPAYSQYWVITRTSVDDPVSSGTVNHTFQAAGMLLRAIYCFLDADLNLIDISQLSVPASMPAATAPTIGADGQITFQWGATVIKTQEPFSHNLTRAFERYGELPPIGTLFHDFFEDHTLTEMIDTARLASVQTKITGLPANVVTMHTIEERMIPVRNG